MCQEVEIADDGLLEETEEFEARLSVVNEPAAVVDPNRTVVRIADNDGKPYVYVHIYTFLAEISN